MSSSASSFCLSLRTSGAVAEAGSCWGMSALHGQAVQILNQNREFRASTLAQGGKGSTPIEWRCFEDLRAERFRVFLRGTREAGVFAPSFLWHARYKTNKAYFPQKQRRTRCTNTCPEHNTFPYVTLHHMLSYSDSHSRHFFFCPRCISHVACNDHAENAGACYTHTQTYTYIYICTHTHIYIYICNEDGLLNLHITAHITYVHVYIYIYTCTYR